MTRYADPRRCPDCGGPISPGTAVCPSCDLPLSGHVAQELFVTLTRADTLLASLRAAAPVGTATEQPSGTVPVPPPVTSAPSAPSWPWAPAATPTGRPVVARHTLSAASVPKILLALGAACLLVAALVFLAYTWTVMSVAGRTATLVGVTALAGGLAAWTAHRGLRAAAESLTLVALGLLTLDTFGARSSGWFGDLSGPGFLVLLGVLLASCATAAALAVRRSPARALSGAEVVAALGTALVAAGVAGLDALATSPGLVLAVLVGSAAAAGGRWLRLPVATAGAAVVAAGAWSVLVAVAIDRAVGHPTLHALWARFEVWPLLAAAALVGTLALLRRLPVVARVGAAATGYALVVAAVLAPVVDETADRQTGAVLGVLAVTALVARAAHRPWWLVGSLVQVVGGLGMGLVAVQLAAVGLVRLGAEADPPWGGAVGDRIPRWDQGGLPDGWLLPVAVLVLGATVLVLGRAVPALASRRLFDVPLGDLRPAAALALATTVATLGLYPVPVWLPVLVLGASGLAGAAAWLRDQRPGALWIALAAFAAGTAVALHAEWLTAAVLGSTAAAAAVVHLRARSPEVAQGAGLALAVALAGEVWTVGALADAPRVGVALAGLLVLGALVLAGPAAPDRWWAAPATSARTGVEAGAGAAAAPLVAAGVLLAPAGDAATWAAVYLTVAGAVVVAMSLLRGDRRLLGWPGGVLLAVASWVRLWDVGVHQPEAYTLPSAVALLVVGLVHLRRVARASTVAALSPGLALAVLPSLVWALGEPASLRGLLLGLGCFGLVVAGVRVRWTAPVLWGAATGALLVARFAAPYIGEAVPRWVLIGTAGAVLIAMGVTWERRLTEVRHVVGYVRGLR